jgi:hypothetical protein
MFSQCLRKYLEKIKYLDRHLLYTIGFENLQPPDIIQLCENIPAVLITDVCIFISFLYVVLFAHQGTFFNLSQDLF